ncbi:MAG TPA: hypothetical protein VIU33_02255 [Nitrospiria bacterium]
MIWDFFKRRRPGDIDRLVSGYRYLLKATHQGQGDPLSPWKGGFAQAYHFLNNDWPSPNENRRFESLMERWMKKFEETDQAYVHALNEYLKQKKLNTDEVQAVIGQAKQAYFKK